MAVPPTSCETMLRAIQQFRNGTRSDRGPRPGAAWLDDARHRYVIVHEGAPYPIREIVRLAVTIETGEWRPGTWDNAGSARKYAEQYGFAVVRKDQWRQVAR